MTKAAWSQPTSQSEVYRRAQGRARYNRRRQLTMNQRRVKVAELLFRYGTQRGTQARIAEQLEVPYPTINRDVRAILGSERGCPTCGRLGWKARRW
ncbi:MAG: hypothetical protein ABR529_15805 [Actinomycetota bacterium]